MTASHPERCPQMATASSSPDTPTGWQARLNLDFSRRGDQTCSTYSHEGPLRVLQALYPEGPRVCHHVLIHPPGGLVGGDRIDMAVQVGEGAHAFITTPGATRFYRSAGAPASQQVQMVLAPDARLEWLPLETIAYDGCRARNHWSVSMAAGAQLMAWDVLALGLPQSGQPYLGGQYGQHFEIDGVWLDRGQIDGADLRLMQGPVGLSGYRCLATLVLASGSDMAKDRLEQALDQARGITASSDTWLGVTSPHPRVVVARVLAQQTEPAMAVLQQIWAQWRIHQWGLAPQASRMWRV
jgi:urease accessory protein